MSLLSHELHTLLLESVANDYEQLSSIVEQLSDWLDKGSVSLEETFVRTILRECISSEEIAAFYLSANKPYFSWVKEVSEEDLGEAWFYITPKGGELLRRAKSE